ncbi:MAG: site-2 protease family protein [Verrucomicrobiae bacterium]|nr:site-2 protease family protein [Verrucomicrobiae bacterium]
MYGGVGFNGAVISGILLIVSILILFLLALNWSVRKSTGKVENATNCNIRFYDFAFDDIADSILKVKAKLINKHSAQFEGMLRDDDRSAFEKVESKLTPQGYGCILEECENGLVRLTIFRPKRIGAKDEMTPSIWVHGFLLFATIVTTTWAGAAHQGVNLVKEPDKVWMALLYSVPLMSILLAHELGHYFAAKRHGIKVTLPYFIPVPFALGTFGAFIKMRSIVRNRIALFDVAIAGPLAGLVLAIPALLLGLRHSSIVPFPEQSGGLDVGSSILIALLSKLSIGDSLELGSQVVLNPIAFSGWLGLLLTALNLLPIGQLDGGHIAHSIFGPVKAHYFSLASIVLLLILAFFVWPGLLFFAILVIFVAGTRDHPVLDDLSSISRGRKWMGYASFALLLTILMPIPHFLYSSLGLNCPYL